MTEGFILKFIADFHIHSKFSRATSKDMDLEHISEWAKLKGVNLMGTGDFTHPLWNAELKKKLKSDGKGLFNFDGTKFILTTEVCNIYHHDGDLKKIHTMIICPSFEAADKINKELGKFADLMSDGRPIFTFSAKRIAEIVFSASSDCLLVPCHIWTPWFSLFGANSGFKSIRECFEEYTRNIFAVETGLSSDPEMNWRVSALDKVALISNSDAHSPSKIGREANVFDCELSYKGVTGAIKSKDKSKFLFTIEFFPEEGKYYYDGHRACKVCLSPKETKKNKKKCPKCGKPLTIGVLNRINKLADRKEGIIPPNAVPFKKLVPLVEIIGEVLDKAPDSATVKKEYVKMISAFGNEFAVLLDVPLETLSKYISEKFVEAIKRVREGKLNINPGYDGEYGKILIFKDSDNPHTIAAHQSQISLF